MKLQEIADHELRLRALSERIGPTLKTEYREAMEHATFVLAELRHFAVCWEHADEQGVPPAADHRRAITGRLIQMALPTKETT